MKTITQLDTFTRQYLAAALWSSTDDSDETGGEPLDRNYSLSDLSPETIEAAVKDCADFQEANRELLEKAFETDGYDQSTAGHDFWLTRNGHGAGFWDRGLEETGKALSDAAEVYGSVDLYVGDDGMIYGG